MAQGNNKRFNTVMESLQNIINEIEGEYINLSPHYQRNVVWNPQLREDLIRSILNGYYIPPVIVQEQDDQKQECVDGKQRLTTIYKYYLNKFGVKLPGKSRRVYYKDLEEQQKKKFQRYQLAITKIYGYTDVEKETQFKMIQNSQSMRGSEKIFASESIKLIREIKRKFSNIDTLEKDLQISNKRMELFQFVVFCYAIIDPDFNSQYNDSNISKFYKEKNDIDTNIINFIYNKITEISRLIKNKNKKLKGYDILHLLSILNYYKNQRVETILEKYLEIDNLNSIRWRRDKSRNNYKKDIDIRLKYFIENANINYRR